MKEPECVAIAMNAAGIADAFRVCQLGDDDGAARWDDLSEQFQGWIGVVEQIVLAAKVMEQQRSALGRAATWGGELPYIYDVWDAIAHVLWNELPVDNMQQLVARAVTQAHALEER